MRRRGITESASFKVIVHPACSSYMWESLVPAELHSFISLETYFEIPDKLKGDAEGVYLMCPIKPTINLINDPLATQKINDSFATIVSN